MRLNMFFRIMLDCDNLAEEIVSKLPEDLFVSVNSTFLDPAFGGGQFLVAIAKRLHKYGHSIKNIKSRLYGYEDNLVYMNHAKNKTTHKIANLNIVKYQDFLDGRHMKKFDVIISNPPYQNLDSDRSKTNQGGGTKFYIQFMELASKINKNQGSIAFIVPASIFKTTRFGEFGQALSKIQEHKIVYAKTDVSKHFNVGVKICYFVAKKTEDEVSTIINDKKTTFNGFYANETELQSIAEKLLTNQSPIKIERDKSYNTSGLSTSRYAYLCFDQKVEDTNLFWHHSEPEKLKRLLKTNMFARVAWDGFVILDKRWYHHFWSALYVHPHVKIEMTDDEIMNLYGLTVDEKNTINKIDRRNVVK